MTASLEARVQQLEDIAAITALKSRYLRACDLKQPDVVRDCFAEGKVEIDYEGFPLFDDRDAFAKIYETMKIKEAAKLLENLDEQLVVNVISVMNTDAAANILANMDTKKAAKISQVLSTH